jgi:hypothetical protein
MQKLTFSESKGAQALAFVKGGRFDGEVVFIDDGTHKPVAQASKKELPREQLDFTPYLKGMKSREKVQISARLNKALLLDREPEEDIRNIYDQVKKKDIGTKLELVDGTMQPVPFDGTRTVAYSFGLSGSGKTFWTYHFALQYKKMYPKNPIYLISRLEEDDTLDKLKPTLKRILIDDSFESAGLKSEDFRDSLVIADDFDTLPAKQKKAVCALIDDMLQVGRHFNISLALTAHLGSDYKSSRMILNEAHYITAFVGGSNPKAIKYVMETYGGLDSKDVRKVMKLPSRWVTLKRTYPGAIIYSSGCYLTGASDD